MELEDLRAGLCREELRLTEAFKEYMLISSALAEYGHENNVPVSDRAAEEERLKNSLKATDAYLRPYMEEFLTTLYALSWAFRSEILDDLED
ncbi:MAG: hypothetical protein E7460_01795 [Ruminococcaceae bacterium]|nr:hypothetical protein [Oscillospiraceae bacterium]